MNNGRIIKGIGGLYHVATQNGIYKCSVRGIFRKKNLAPVIGDYVTISVKDESAKEASINEIHQRKNLMLRPRVSNIDQAIIVVAPCNPPINLELLDRLLILAEDISLKILICVNKSDLMTQEMETITEQYLNIGYPLINTSALTGEGINALNEFLSSKVSVFAGPSGVGKSSLVNALLPDFNAPTGELSTKISRGKHTTRHAEILEVFDGSFIVDSPGFSSLTMENISKQKLPTLFPEFRPFLDNCRFKDCIHINEPNCAIKEQINQKITKERYERYVSISNEIKEQPW